MADVVRFSREIQEVVYTVGPESVQRAMMAWLCDEHAAAFNETTELRFGSDGYLTVTTRFDARGMSAGTAEPAAQSQREAHQPGRPEADAPHNPSQQRTGSGTTAPVES